MKNIVAFVCLSIAFTFCKSPTKHDTSPTSIFKENANKKIANVDIFECTTARDTVFASGNHIRYVAIDTMFGVEIKIGNSVDTLDFRFNCHITNGLIPNILYEEKNLLVLKQGFAFTFRNTIVCEKKGNKMECHGFEISRSASDVPEILVYKTGGTCAVKFFFINAKKTKSIMLPMRYCNNEIKLVIVYLKHVIIKFLNDEEFNISL